LTKEMNEPER